MAVPPEDVLLSVSSIVNRLYEKGNGGKPSNGGDALQWIIGA